MSTQQTILAFSYYWTDAAQRYVLLKTDGSPRRAYMPYDLRMHASPYLFEDADLFQVIVEKMLDSGVPVFDKLPDRGDTTADFSALLMVSGGMTAAESNKRQRAILEMDWNLTDELLQQGKKYPEICEIRAQFVAREIEKQVRLLGLRE